MFKKKLLTRTVDGKYVMNAKDVVEFERMLGLACTAMDESEKDNERLRHLNMILENKCVGLRSKLDQVTTNLYLALGRKVDGKQDVMHLINVCVALVARESEYRYTQAESDRLKHTLERQLGIIRVETLNGCDELLNTVDKLKEEIIVKDTKMSDLTDDIHSIKAENDEKNANARLYEYRLSIELENTKNELHQGKCLIARQINRLEGRYGIDIENYRLYELIGMVTTSISKLKENENNFINEHFLKIQRMCNDLLKENENLKISTKKYKRQLLANKKQKCDDKDKLIEQLKSSATEQKQNEILLQKKYEQATLRIKNLSGETIPLIVTHLP